MASAFLASSLYVSDNNKKKTNLKFFSDLSAGKALSSIKALWDGFIFSRRTQLEVFLEPTYKSFGII